MMRPTLELLCRRFTVGDGCWEWNGSRNQSGYGRFTLWIDGKVQGFPAHRVVYEYVVGPIPEGLVIDHLCRNRACVRPAHLEPVTQAENVRRGLAARGVSLKHGSDSMYVSGCRCDACRLARSTAARRRAAVKRERVAS